MTGLRRSFLVAGAAVAIAMMAVVETPLAQNSGGNSAPGVHGVAGTESSSAAADKKADSAMTAEPSATKTDADRKAATAMGSGPVSTK
jgi:hypothetical protein